MLRTLKTGLRIWKRRGLLWPAALAAGAAGNAWTGLPRGLMVEATRSCTGGCLGCPPPDNPADLPPELLARWLGCRRTPPVTIHFSGKHSDPLAAPRLGDLLDAAGACGSMVSISTIGLGLPLGMETLPADRWIFSIPAATGESWRALRGVDRLDEALASMRRVISGGAPMVELVLTIWNRSADDVRTLPDLARETGAHGFRAVFGRFDPEGRHIGRVENLALDSPCCPYRLNPEGTPVLKKEPRGCPLTGCLFLDASGAMRPCPFAGDGDPSEAEPSLKAWSRAASWKALKRSRAFSACRFCP